MQKIKNNKKRSLVCLTALILTVAIVVAVLVLTKCTGVFDGEQTEENTDHYINIGEGLKITLVGSYNGFFMEDGSDEKIEDALTIVVLNTSENDLQYAEIYLKYEDYTAEFTVSNLPSNEKVLLLEKKRAPSRNEKPKTYLLENATFFNSPMDIKQDVIEITGVNGVVNIKNTSDEDIVGDIVIAYKNYANDMFYGGVTYRITVTGGLKAGQIKQMNAGHFSPTNSKIVNIDIVK